MQYSTMVFDLDGTLIHTRPEYRYAVTGKALSVLGKQMREKHVDRFWFEANRSKIIEELFEVEPDVFWKEFLQHHTPEAISKYIETYGDISVLTELQKRGVKLGIVTGAHRAVAQRELALLPVQVPVVYSRTDEGFEPKPHPGSLQHCIKLLNSSPEHTLYIGNSTEDIEMARAAGVMDAFIDRKEHEFPDLKPSISITSLTELLRFA